MTICFTSRTPSQPHRPLPFFQDLHQEVSRSWKQPFLVRITKAADFATVSKMAKHGYGAMPTVEETLATHLAPNSAPSWKSRPLLPSKPCRITSSLVEKSLGRLQPLCILWACFKPIRQSFSKSWIKGKASLLLRRLRRAELMLRATKHTARAVGRSMAGMVSFERHLWLTLTGIKEKDKSFLLDAPISKYGLFGYSVTTVVEKFRSAKQQFPAFHQLIPRRPREAERQPPVVRSRSSSLHLHREVQRGEPSPMAPPQKDWGPRSCPLVRPHQRKRIDLSLMATASLAPSSSSWFFHSALEARPFFGEFVRTVQAYPHLSLCPPSTDINCHVSDCTSGGFRSSPYVKHLLRHSVDTSLQS